MEGEAYFLSDIGFCQYYDVDYCFYRVKPTAVILCSYAPFFLYFCVVILFNCILYCFNHCFNLCICRNSRFVYSRFLKKEKQKRQFYVTALFPTLRYNKRVVCISQLSPSRHLMCVLTLPEIWQLICQGQQSHTGATLLNHWQEAVCMCVCVFSILFKNLLFYGYYCTSKDF